MIRFFSFSTVAAGFVALTTASCGDSEPAKATGPATGVGGGLNAGGTTLGDGAVSTGGAATSSGGVSGGGGGLAGGGSGAGGAPAGGASAGTGGSPPVSCASDGDCANPNPYCDTTARVCVRCLGDANCPNGETCNTTTHRCVECATSGDCPNTSPYCDADGRCVDCLTHENCGGQNPGPGVPTMVCSPQHTCVPGCTESSQCQSPFGQANVCDTTTNECVQCLTNADCGGGGDAGRPIICTSQHTCTPGCNGDEDCAQNATRRHCNTATSLCVQCASSADCGQQAPYCFTDTGTCVACLTDQNCANAGGVCNQQFHVCACTQNSDCPQGQQCFGGRCF
jgi:Cys-rich repeat protein